MTEVSSLLALGLMSGTSADGIDAALVETDGLYITSFGATNFIPYPEEVKSKILELSGQPVGSKTHLLERLVTELHGKAVKALIEKARLKPSDIDIIGFHGQTLFHQPPQKKGEIGTTHIIGNGQLLASLTGIPVIDQFRLNDIAHGGQGAPFVPIFHAALTRNLAKPLALLNIGGVSNITWLGSKEDQLLGFDIGPGNGLIDEWIRANSNLPWDEKGKLAALGQVHQNFIEKWLSHTYFNQLPPKALDRKTFKSYLEDIKFLSLEDGAATLTAFTAAALEKALSYLPEKPLKWIVSGGGTHNETLLKMIEEKIQQPLQKASYLGWDGDALEAQAFAFLAVRSLKGLPLSYPGTTGAPYPLIGGTLWRPKLEHNHKVRFRLSNFF